MKKIKLLFILLILVLGYAKKAELTPEVVEAQPITESYVEILGEEIINTTEVVIELWSDFE